MKIKFILIGCITALVIVLTMALSGCNTVQGFGKDMQQGGQDLQKAASDNKSS